MKTKVLFIAALFLGGLLLSSCQKDNSLSDQASASLKSAPWASENEQGQTYDPIANYPDPFKSGTTIYYKIASNDWVNLSVLDENMVWVGELVNKYQVAGDYMVKFDGANLPAGKYIARLKVGPVVYNEIMTKKPLFQEEKHNPVDPAYTN